MKVDVQISAHGPVPGAAMAQYSSIGVGGCSFVTLRRALVGEDPIK